MLSTRATLNVGRRVTLLAPLSAPAGVSKYAAPQPAGTFTRDAGRLCPALFIAADTVRPAGGRPDTGSQLNSDTVVMKASEPALEKQAFKSQMIRFFFLLGCKVLIVT